MIDELHELLKEIEITDSNYSAVIHQLNEQYGDTKKFLQMLNPPNDLFRLSQNLNNLKSSVINAKQLRVEIKGFPEIQRADLFIKSVLVQKLFKITYEWIVIFIRKLTLDELFMAPDYLIERFEYSHIIAGESIPVLLCKKKVIKIYLLQ